MVTVYSRPGCQACRATTRRLAARGVPFDLRLLDEQARELVDALRTAGASALPIVVDDAGEMFSGYRPELLDRLA